MILYHILVSPNKTSKLARANSAARDLINYVLKMLC
jgi:hypothetical protein